MASPELERLRSEAARFGVALTGDHLVRFSTYLELLLRWNRKISLTAVTEPDQVIDRHFLDSLAVLQLIEAGGRLIDVGAGAGFPGIPLAVVRPDLGVTLLEATAKKAAFLRAAVHALGLACQVADVRLEEFLRQPFEPFDYAVSRATFAPAEWLVRAKPLVRSRGSILVMTGREDPPAGAERMLLYSLPDGEQRHLARYRSST